MHIKLLVTGGSGFIGTNVIAHFLLKGVHVVNLDVRPPLKDTHRPHWIECDIMDAERLHSLVAAERPSHVIHLAARTDTDDDEVDNYRVNIDGTAHLLQAVRALSSVKRLVITSTQFVCGPGYWPQHDEDFAPHTAYGESKVHAERLTREAELQCVWTIIRPTNIWGPWHPRYPYEFWRVLRDGWYVHPGHEPVIRSYGYVGNVVYQIDQILHAPARLVDRHVCYVGDEPLELLKWVNGFSRAIAGRDTLVVPRLLVRMLAGAGDVLKLFKFNVPIHSSRYKSMTQNYPTPMQATFEAFGQPPYSLEDGIRETVEWLRQEGFL